MFFVVVVLTPVNAVKLNLGGFCISRPLFGGVHGLRVWPSQRSKTATQVAHPLSAARKHGLVSELTRLVSRGVVVSIGFDSRGRYHRALHVCTVRVHGVATPGQFPRIG